MFNDFKIIFLAITIEALPFLLVGAFIASIIELYVDEGFIKKLLPKNLALQMVTASFVGLFFPVCECAIIPIARGFIRKGVPVPVALVFMFVTPIINPVALASTWFAFQETPLVVAYRAGGGILVALFIGLFFIKTRKEEALLNTDGHSHHHHSHSHELHTVKGRPKRPFLSLVRHTRDEFFDVGIFLVMGAAISALIQVAAPLEGLELITGSVTTSALSLQVLAYLLSLCSHADAFVASGFMLHFPLHAVMAFLITSPMIDVKNTIVMLGLFQVRFTWKVIILVFTITFIASILFSLTGMGT